MTRVLSLSSSVGLSTRVKCMATKKQLKYWNSKKGIAPEHLKGLLRGVHPIREFKKGFPPPPHKVGCKCFRCDKKIGVNHHLWKGEFGSYSVMHTWVVRWKGKAKSCVDCGTLIAKKYEWSNIDHKYRRNLDDYISRCSSCHKIYDYAKF